VLSTCGTTNSALPKSEEDSPSFLLDVHPITRNENRARKNAKDLKVRITKCYWQLI
jgi:hypothetical protein